MSSKSILINGTWESGNETATIRSPFSGDAIQTIGLASEDQMNRAISAATEAFKEVREMPHYRVKKNLEIILTYISDRKQDFAETITLESGKPIVSSLKEVDRAIATFRDAIKECGNMHGQTIPMDLTEDGAHHTGIQTRFGIGPIASITPFNFPLNLVVHKIAPALAARNTIVHKPAPQTPLTAMLLGAAFCETDFPAGTLNIVPCEIKVAKRLIEDDRIKLLSFTGSTEVGWQLKKQAYKKKVCLECGGNASLIIHSDGNFKRAVSACVSGAFGYAGQSCISIQRVFVHVDLLDSFLSEVKKKTDALKLGDPMKQETQIGPLISNAAADRVESWINEATQAGATLISGGTRKGPFISPTILTGTSPQMKVNKEEVFGPVMTVEPYTDLKNTIDLINDSEFGLQTGIFTNDINLIHQCYQQLDVGALIVNQSPTWRMDHMPYGGTKMSGNTREGVRYAMEEMSVPKLMVIRTDP